MLISELRDVLDHLLENGDAVITLSLKEMYVNGVIHEEMEANHLQCRGMAEFGHHHPLGGFLTPEELEKWYIQWGVTPGTEGDDWVPGVRINLHSVLPNP